MKTIRLEVDDLFEDISKPSLSIIGPDYKVIVLYRDPRAIMTSITLRWSTCRLRFFSRPILQLTVGSHELSQAENIIVFVTS